MNISHLINKAIHCDTQTKADLLCQKLHELGYKWQSGESYITKDIWFTYKEKTCYNIHKGIYCEISYFEKYKYEIISFDDIDFYNIEEIIDEINNKLLKIT